MSIVFYTLLPIQSGLMQNSRLFHLPVSIRTGLHLVAWRMPSEVHAKIFLPTLTAFARDGHI